MAVDTRNLPSFLSNDADFRTWGSGIAAQLAAVGLVQTADTGQINWATVLRPGVVNTVAGYEIWRFNDPLQTQGKTVHIKVEYGVAGAVDRPSLWMQVGLSGTNGAGGLSGVQTSERRQVASTSSKTAGAVLASYMTGGDGRFHMLSNHDPAGSQAFTLFWGIERFKKADGTMTDEGLMTVAGADATTWAARHQVLYYVGTVGSPTSAGMPALTPTIGLSNVGNAVFIAPYTIAYGEPRYTWAFAYKPSDLASMAVVSVTQFGAAYNFLPLGQLGSNNAWALQTGAGIAIPWF